jgi:hypothetical protein
MTSFGNNPSSLFLYDLPEVRTFPEWVTSPEQGKSSGKIATFSLCTGLFWNGISFIPDEAVTPL